MTHPLQSTIDLAWDARTSLEPGNSPEIRTAVDKVIAALDAGEIRVAEKKGVGEWVVNQWVKKAVLLSFRLTENHLMQAGDLAFFDKVEPKFGTASASALRASGVRVVPPAVARRGSYLAKNVVMMPSYVNIGAYVDENTMIDTWATVGSCAQIGARVHLAGGVGIGGVLEPVNARPVIVEDEAFIGSRSIVTEGVVVERGAILGANVVLTGSTPVLDVTGSEPFEHRGRVPAGAVVIPGTRQRTFPAGEFGVATGLIVGWRSQRQEARVSLNEALREHGVAT